MRAVVQRVRDAEVRVEGKPVGRAGSGLLVYVGIADGDVEADCDFLVEKIAGLRVFDDGDGKMNLSVAEAGGSVLVVSQFTLMADARKGKRPSYSGAARPEDALPLYERCIAGLRSRGLEVSSGVFQANMAVSYTNLGPVTILLDSKKLF